MTAKIITIKGHKAVKQVLLALSRCDETGNDFIELSAWHETKEDGDCFQYEEIKCDDRDILLNIITSFTELAATKWVDSYSY